MDVEKGQWNRSRPPCRLTTPPPPPPPGDPSWRPLKRSCGIQILPPKTDKDGDASHQSPLVLARAAFSPGVKRGKEEREAAISLFSSRPRERKEKFSRHKKIIGRGGPKNME
jgi:hypothetical protein